MDSRTHLPTTATESADVAPAPQDEHVVAAPVVGSGATIDTTSQESPPPLETDFSSSATAPAASPTINTDSRGNSSNNDITLGHASVKAPPLSLAMNAQSPSTPQPTPSQHSRTKAAEHAAITAEARSAHRANKSSPSYQPTRTPSSTTKTNTTAAVARAGQSPHILTTGPHYNAHQLTTTEEHALFRRRYGVSPSYHGRVVVEEDNYVTCSGCGGQVDPVERVPAGKLFFHPRCIHCALCGQYHGNVTHPFVQVGDKAICENCSSRGFARCL